MLLCVTQSYCLHPSLSAFHFNLASLSDEVLAWFSVWSEIQMFAYGPADANATPSSFASSKSRVVEPFWCRLTQVVLEKRPLNGCLSLQ